MIIKKVLHVLLLIIPFVLITGCIHGRDENTILTKVFKGTELIPDQVNKICIIEIINRSTIQELPGILRTDMKRKINTGGRLYMTDDVKICDAAIRIILLPMLSEPLKFNSAGIPEERRIRIDALVTMTHSSTGDEVIRNRNTYAYHTYRVSGKGSVSEYRGITGLTEKLAEKIISVITTGWSKEDTLKRSGREN